MITGGAGFIGANLCRAILRRQPQARLTVLDDLRLGVPENLDGVSGTFVKADLSREGWEASVPSDGFDAVFHLASITDTTLSDDAKMIHDNVEGFRRLLAFAASRKTPVVYASSAGVYGKTDRPCAEDSPRRPANAYSRSKAQMEDLAAEASRKNPDWKIAGLRYFNVYGPYEAHKGKAASMAYQLARQMMAGSRPRIYRAGEQRRDFVHVADAAEGTILAWEALEGGKIRSGSVYNIGSGRARSFNELVACLNAALGTDFDPDYFDNPYESFYQDFTEADLTRSCRDLGYRPRYDLETGIREYVQWLKSVG